MAFVTHVGTAVPKHTLAQATAATLVGRSLGLAPTQATALQALFDNTRVATRHSVLPAELLGEHRSLSDTMALYGKHALELGLSAARDCLSRAALEPRQIDLVVTASCTGVLLPSLGALLVAPLGLRNDVRRLPLTEMGCAGGASALACANDFVRAHPQAHVLVVAVELPSLTFQRDDTSATNLVASAIFGDGAAAALLQGERAAGVEILDTRTGIADGTLGDMGFELRDGGFHVVLSKDVPRIIAEHTPPMVAELLSRYGVTPGELEFYVLHPGGRKVLAALESALELEPHRALLSWEVLARYGNQSSASVLFVLRETLLRGVPAGYGLLAAFGPGITVELALLRGHPC